MKISQEDPRLTAYALGEIENAAERKSIERAVAEDPELQAVVDEIRRTADWLQQGFADEAKPELSEFDIARMETPPQAPTLADRLGAAWAAHKGSIVGLAAAVAFAAILIPQMLTYKEQSVPRIESQGDIGPLTDDDEGLHFAEDEGKDTSPEGLKVGRDADARPTDTNAMSVGNQEAPEAESPPIGGSEASQSSPARTMSLAEFRRQHSVEKKAPIADRSVTQPMLSMPVAEEPAAEADYADEPGVSRLASNAPRPSALPVDNDFVADGFSNASTVGTRERLRTDVEVAWERPKAFAEKPADKRGGEWNTESYDPIEESGFRSPLVAPLSTFSIDVDTASYANVRRFLNQGQLPPVDAVRIEELINYFPYEDTAPTDPLDHGGAPFAVHLAQTTAPWNEAHRLLRIGLKGYEMPWEDRPASNLVFLLDVSGSMNHANKLPLVKEAMDLLVRRLDRRDRVAIVVYAGASGLVLPSTTADNSETIRHALDQLKAGGSTNAGAGIELAYKVARDHFIEDGNNRVILCTDGDFNVGLTNRGALADLAEAQAESGVSLTILGFGMGNYKDDMLESLSNKGKGSYAYVDSSAEARKVFLEDLASNIFKIAKDVKIQVEFNPASVQAYRLIGYENRRLKAEDFNDDRKKAGDIGPGHTVVALYEIVPAGVRMELPGVDELRYQSKPDVAEVEGELATVKLRYKQPEGTESRLLTQTVEAAELTAFSEADDDVRFAAAVAAFGMRLRASEQLGEFGYDAIERIAADALGRDPGGHRSEFTELVRKAQKLAESE